MHRPKVVADSCIRGDRIRKSLVSHFDSSPCKKVRNLGRWHSLNTPLSEFNPALTLVTGQSFRWRQTGPSKYTGVVGSFLFSLEHKEDDTFFYLHSSSGNVTGEENTDLKAEEVLRDYLNLDISLEALYKKFSQADVRFAAIAPYVIGSRMLRQDPLECVFQFICSSNNNIQRITKMVDYLASFGPELGIVNGHTFHAFPTLDVLEEVSEEQLRIAGFGYRAKYIVSTVRALQLKEGGGAEWLYSLRGLPLQEAIDGLCLLSGVGPKVAACVALFSLDKHHAIPVDTHVWQIAVRYLMPELAGKQLCSKLHHTVSEAFVNKFGEYAGWAHTVLFIAELSSFQEMLPSHLQFSRKNKGSKS